MPASAAMLTLLKDFTFVGASLDEFHTDWVAYPAEWMRVEFTVDVRSRIGSGNVLVFVETSWDTDGVLNTAMSMVAGSPGISTAERADAPFGPWIRLRLKASGTARSIFSVWLTPKGN